MKIGLESYDSNALNETTIKVNLCLNCETQNLLFFFKKFNFSIVSNWKALGTINVYGPRETRK